MNDSDNNNNNNNNNCIIITITIIITIIISIMIVLRCGYLHSAKGGAVETGCSELHNVIHYVTI